MAQAPATPALSAFRQKKKLRLWLGIIALLFAVPLLLLLQCRYTSSSRLPPPALHASPKAVRLAEVSTGLDDIQIDAVFRPETRSLHVTQQLLLTNRDHSARDTLVLRTYPNAYQNEETSPIATEEFFALCYPKNFSGGSLVIASISAAMENEAPAPISHRYTDGQKTVMECRLPALWQPQTALRITLSYTVTLPRAANRFGENNGFWAFGNAFALPAVWEDGAYRTDPYFPVGDPFLSDCFNFSARITMPKGYVCAGSGLKDIRTEHDGSLVYSFEAQAARDFALCFSEQYTVAHAMQGDTTVAVYAANRSAAELALRYTTQALACFEELYGEYPYLSLTVAEVDFPFGGMEYPSLIMLSSDLLLQKGQTLEWTIAHEVAHQWWYAVVGSDPVRDAWQDEALAEYSLLRYAEMQYGREAREDLQFTRIETAMRVLVPRGITPGSPLDYFETMSEYSLVVYRRGAALLCALDIALDGMLDDFLKAYYHQYAFQRASRADFESLLNAHAAQDLHPLMVDYLDTYLLN